jgi:hypothetical protein
MKKNLYTERNRGHAKQKGKMPASRGCWTGGAGAHAQETNPLQGGMRFRCDLGDHNGWTSKRQKTRSLESIDNNDNQTAGERVLSDGNDMTIRGATPHQESASRDQSTGGYTVGNMVSHQPRVKETRRGNLDTRAGSNDGARVRDNNVGSPPYELQPVGRQDFFREPVLLGVTR